MKFCSYLRGMSQSECEEMTMKSTYSFYSPLKYKFQYQRTPYYVSLKNILHVFDESTLIQWKVIWNLGWLIIFSNSNLRQTREVYLHLITIYITFYVNTFYVTIYIYFHKLTVLKLPTENVSLMGSLMRKAIQITLAS